jgi:hypothetical protein
MIIIMRYLIIGLIIFLSACNTRENNKKISDINSLKTYENYPKEIINRGLKKCFDNAKWTMYCLYCDSTCNFAENTGLIEKITFASLDLRLKEVKQFSDTTEIRLSFFYRDSIECKFPTIYNQNIVTGVGFKKKCDSIYYYTSDGVSYRFWTNDPNNRYGKPLQPDVIHYIRNNSQRLSSWFQNQARKRGIL